MSTTRKLSYSRWLHARSLIDEARARGMSLTEISRVVRGDGDTPGWADSARQHRSIVTEADVAKLEALRPEYVERKGNEGTTRLSEPQAKKYRQLIWRLHHEQGWTLRQIADAIGISPGAVGYSLRGRYGGTVRSLNRVQKLVDAIEAQAAQAKAEEAQAKPLLNGTAEAPEGEADEPEPEPARQPAKPTVTMKPKSDDSFEAQLLATREAARSLLDQIEMLGAVVPAFGRAGIEQCRKDVQSILENLS